MKIEARILLVVIIVTATISPAWAQHYGHLGSKTPSPCDSIWKQPIGLILKAGTGVNHPVDTNIKAAQDYFNQGLTLFYGFDGEAAMRSFNQAAQADPKLAMAHWGIALASGGDLNIPIDDPCMALAVQQAREALKLVQSTSKESDREYVNALARRYAAEQPVSVTRDPRQLEVLYMQAMSVVAQKFGNTDPDSITLYAGSLMNLRPWLWWDNAGNVSQEAQLAINALQSGLKNFPDHIGLNHYLIHAIEEAPKDKLAPALDAARQLVKLAPEITPHLQHMPAHIFFRLGFWSDVVAANDRAVQSDQRWVDECKTNICDPTFVGHYYSHDLLFLAVGYNNQGRWADVINTAQTLEANAHKYLFWEPGLEHYLTTRALMMVHFGKWQNIVNEPDPQGTTDPINCAQLPRKLEAASWYFAKSAAFATLGDAVRADQYLKRFVVAKSCVQATAMGWGNNPAVDILDVTHWILLQRIARSRNDWASAEWFARLAVETQDQLLYDEPPGWYLPTRESLGAVLYLRKNYSDAKNVFQAELGIHPNNSRALFGLWQTLKALGDPGAAEAEKNFKNQWKGTDLPRIEDL